MKLPIDTMDGISNALPQSDYMSVESQVETRCPEKPSVLFMLFF